MKLVVEVGRKWSIKRLVEPKPWDPVAEWEYIKAHPPHEYYEDRSWQDPAWFFGRKKHRPIANLAAEQDVRGNQLLYEAGIEEWNRPKARKRK